MEHRTIKNRFELDLMCLIIFNENALGCRLVNKWKIGPNESIGMETEPQDL